MLFACELSRRLLAGGHATIAGAAHPGYSATDLQAVGPRMGGRRVVEQLFGLANRLVAQSAAMGALPTLYAATAPGMVSGMRSEEHTSELQSLMRISYAVFCLQQKKTTHINTHEQLH